MAKRNLYLKTTSVEESIKKYMDALGVLNPKTEWIQAYDSLGRVTCNPVFAKCCSPLFNAAAMDGIAVRSKDTREARESTPLTLKRNVDYKVIDTGDPVKSPYDAVIMAEDVIEIDENTVQIIASVPAWNHVRPIGEDIVAGEMILPTGHEIRPVDVGVLLASGNVEIEVYKKTRVGIIPTGTEIIKPGAEPKEGDIIDSNSGMFAAMVMEKGGLPEIYDIVDDDYEAIKNQVSEAVKEQDVVVVSAGSSAGTEDYTVHILREIGDVIIHGVAMKPGKPVILAIVQGKPVIGLPGYPVSAYLAFENFVYPVLEKLGKSQTKHRKTIKAVLSRRLVSSLKHREYVRVKVGKVGDRYVASPQARGAGAAMSLVRADGFCVIPQNSEGYEAGALVDVELYNDQDAIEKTLVSIGSHDLILDLISDQMAVQFGNLHMSSTHVGSMAGLMALKRAETIIAPTHLLDEETGIYNESYLERLFPNESMALIKGVERIQGIMVKKGNPLDVQSIRDLTHVRYVNRQRGAGTRVLLDYLMKKENIRPESVDGYDKEAATHMAVAALVASEEIDAGMGVKSAADAFDLDFIPVGVEEYDFALREKDLQLSQVQGLIDVLKSKEFHEKLDKLGGYHYNHAGQIKIIKKN